MNSSRKRDKKPEITDDGNEIAKKNRGYNKTCSKCKILKDQFDMCTNCDDKCKKCKKTLNKDGKCQNLECNSQPSKVNDV